MTTAANRPTGGSADGSLEIANEFAAVRVSRDETGRGPRLRVEDLETGDAVWLDAVELASIAHATDEQRREWLRTGHYRIDADEP